MASHILKFEQIGPPNIPLGEESFENEIDVKDFLLKYGFKSWPSCDWIIYKNTEYRNISQYVCGSIKVMYIDLIKNKFVETNKGE